MNLINKFWNGDITLWQSYWIFGVVIPIPVGFLLGFLAAMMGLPPISYKLVMLVYLGLTLVGIWRSADKYQGKKIFAILAKIGMVLGVLYALVNVVG